MSLYNGSTRTSRYDVEFGADECPSGCAAAPDPARTHAADTALLRFYGSNQVRIMRYGLDTPIELPDDDDPDSPTASLVPVVDLTKGTNTPRIVVEEFEQDGYVLDLDGGVEARFEPLPGTAFGSVATPDGWYRFHQLSDATGRVEVLDPGTLEPGGPSPEVPCREPRGMSTSRGRLLVLCDTGELVMFGE